MRSHQGKALAVVIALWVALPSLASAQVDGAAEGGEELQLVERPIAILPFRERGKEVENMGGQVADLVFAKLAVDPGLFLVDREDLDKTLAEAELNLSGIVNPAESITIGQLTGRGSLSPVLYFKWTTRSTAWRRSSASRRAEWLALR